MITILATVFTDINQSCYSADGETLIKVTDPSNHLRISSKCKVIQENCFKELKTLLSFTFEENPNLTTIGRSSFHNCQNLQFINLSSCNKFKSIGNSAFYYCYHVKEILLPKGLLKISSFAFSYISSVVSLIIPASVNYIGSNAFIYCSGLQNVSFEEGSNLTYLELLAFYDTNIVSFQIPEKVQGLHGASLPNFKLTNLTIHPNNNYLIIIENDSVFSKDKSILYFICDKSEKTYEIPNITKTLSDACFLGSKFTSVIIPNSITKIPTSCFSATKFTTITIPNSVTSLDTGCFRNSNLNTITIPESVTSIGWWAFDSSSLRNVTLLGPTQIQNNAFRNCDQLELIIFSSTSIIVSGSGFITYSSKLKLLFMYKALFSSQSINKKTYVMISYLNKSDLIITNNSLIMDSEQTEIYEFCVYRYESITIPRSVKMIKERAFENSTIPKIFFEENSQLSIIENYAFLNCSKLQSLDISSSNLSFLGFSSFKYCINLVNFSFPSRDSEILNNAFENCTNLINMYNISNISDCCFLGCTRLIQVNIRDGSELIGAQSFENCSSLKTINIPSSVRIISENAFLNCDNLASIIFANINSLTNFSINSISECKSLNNISNFSSDKYESIYNTIYFKNGTKLDLILHLSQSIDKVININCNTICKYSFNHCQSIENITISPNSVSLIEEFAFNNCPNLRYINFPLSVKVVQPHAFNECKSIQCPLIIERITMKYLKMINESGIPIDCISSSALHSTDIPQRYNYIFKLRKRH